MIRSFQLRHFDFTGGIDAMSSLLVDCITHYDLLDWLRRAELCKALTPISQLLLVPLAALQCSNTSSQLLLSRTQFRHPCECIAPGSLSESFKSVPLALSAKQPLADRSRCEVISSSRKL